MDAFYAGFHSYFFFKNVYLCAEMHFNKDTLSQASIGAKGIRFCVKFKVFFPKKYFSW